jgi:hypothetical protein
MMPVFTLSTSCSTSCPHRQTAIAQQSRFQRTVDSVSALVLCGETAVELSVSQSTRCPLNSLTLDFEGGTIQIPHAFSEQSFGRMEIISRADTITRTFEPVNPYGRVVEDFIALLERAKRVSGQLLGKRGARSRYFMPSLSHTRRGELYVFNDDHLFEIWILGR